MYYLGKKISNELSWITYIDLFFVPNSWEIERWNDENIFFHKDDEKITLWIITDGNEMRSKVLILITLQYNIHEVIFEWVSLFILLLRDKRWLCILRDESSRQDRAIKVYDWPNLSPRWDTIPCSYKPNSELVLAKFCTNAALIPPQSEQICQYLTMPPRGIAEIQDSYLYRSKSEISERYTLIHLRKRLDDP